MSKEEVNRIMDGIEASGLLDKLQVICAATPTKADDILLGIILMAVKAYRAMNPKEEEAKG